MDRCPESKRILCWLGRLLLKVFNLVLSLQVRAIMLGFKKPKSFSIKEEFPLFDHSSQSVFERNKGGGKNLFHFGIVRLSPGHIALL